MSDTNETALTVATTDDYSVDVARVLSQTTAIQRCMQSVMRPGEHYGVIPGTTRPGETPKPTLLQPGADKLGLMFRLRPEYEIVSRTETDAFISREVCCRLYHIQTGECWGEGFGSANSRETKYQNQAMSKVCPKCGKPAIIKGKTEYGGGWLCYAKKDGCGTKFADDDESITNQTGQVNADKLWDLHNTIVKMANKRARVAAVLTATAASDIFTQDLEDLVEAAPTAKTAATPQQTAAQPGSTSGAKPATDPTKASEAQVASLCALMTKLGIKQRTEVLAWINAKIAPRTVASRLDLTPQEATKCIDAAQAEINDRAKE